MVSSLPALGVKINTSAKRGFLCVLEWFGETCLHEGHFWRRMTLEVQVVDCFEFWRHIVSDRGCF